MSEAIVSKQCSKCKEVKPLEEFYRRPDSPIGYRSYCRKCENLRIKTWGLLNKEKRRAAMSAYFRSPRGKEVIKKYTQSAKFKATCRRYRISEKGKACQKKRDALARLRHPSKAKARLAVSHAIEQGKMPSASTRLCSACGIQAKHWHHHNGYSPPHWLDVIPLCLACHTKADHVGIE